MILSVCRTSRFTILMSLLVLLGVVPLAMSGCRHQRTVTDETTPLPGGGTRTTHTESNVFEPRLLPRVPGIIEFTPVPPEAQPTPIQQPQQPPAPPATTPRSALKEVELGVDSQGEFVLRLGDNFYSLDISAPVPREPFIGRSVDLEFSGFGPEITITNRGPTMIGIPNRAIADGVTYKYDPDSNKEGLSASLSYLLGFIYARDTMSVGDVDGPFFAQIIEFKVPAAADRGLDYYLVLALVTDHYRGVQEWVPVLNPYAR